jgi:hypothetical protein
MHTFLISIVTSGQFNSTSVLSLRKVPPLHTKTQCEKYSKNSGVLSEPLIQITAL